MSFSSFGNLAGNTASDLFEFTTGTISGTLAGGGGAETLTGSAIANEIVNVTLTGSSALGLNGTTAAIGAGFSGINVLTGKGTGTLTGESVTGVTGTWTLAQATPTTIARTSRRS